MAIESREISLTKSEIVKALVLFSNRSSSPIPAHAEIERFGADEKGGIFVSLAADGRKQKFESSILLPAIIYFCNLCKIPLPQRAVKNIEWRGSELALVIRNWGFDTPALDVLAA